MKALTNGAVVWVLKGCKGAKAMHSSCSSTMLEYVLPVHGKPSGVASGVAGVASDTVLKL